MQCCTSFSLFHVVKDKSSVLEELEQLRNVQTELTQQVADLTTELEKERSKVHALKTDLDKHEKPKVCLLESTSINDQYVCVKKRWCVYELQMRMSLLRL